jgi:polysaccharide biosynthesis protein PslA
MAPLQTVGFQINHPAQPIGRLRDAVVETSMIPTSVAPRADRQTEDRITRRVLLAWQLFCKRMLDIVLASVALAMLLPLVLVLAALIRIESRGPAIFTQIRWGRDGRKIKVYKFRSMYMDRGDRTGVAQTVKDDPRVTRIGRTIRRLNIDELPQLFNVLKGDMSLVGPRCHAVGMLAGGMPYERLVSDYHRRHAMRPGMTGLAQMRGLRGPTDRISRARARIACDLHYVDHFSIGLDLRIMLGTVMSELRGGKGF